MSNVVLLDSARQPTPEEARLELVTVRGHGGVRLGAYIRAFSAGADQAAVAQTVLVDTTEQAAGSFQELCEVLAACYDEETGSYHFSEVDVDERGRTLPKAPTS